MKLSGRNHELFSGVYALNAMPEAERREFEESLHKSESLWAEAVELQDTAALMGEAIEAVEPPAYLRTRILAQIEVTPQLAAEPAESARREVASVLARVRKFFGGLTPVVPLAAAALVAVAVVTPIALRPAAPAQPPVATGITALAQAKDKQQVELQAGVGNLATVAWSKSLHSAAVKVRANNLGPGKAYELWVVDAKGQVTPAGLIAKGTTNWQKLTRPVSAKDSIRMTVEPNWGSKQPTSPTLFSLSL